MSVATPKFSTAPSISAIRAFVDGNPDTLVIQMTAGTALELATQLMDAALKAKKA